MTETTTIPAKEDNITPVDPEKKQEVKQEPEAIQPENEVSDSKPEDKVKEIKPIDSGYLHKSSKLLVMKHWSRSYFAFGSEGHPISIPNLKTYHRKNVKRGIPKPNVTGNTSSNAEVKDDEPSKVDDSTKVEESKKPDESPKVVEESPKVEESKKPDEPSKVEESKKPDEPSKVEESKKSDEPPKVEESTSADIVEEVKVDDKPKEDVKEESDKKQVDDNKSPETKDEKTKDEETVTPYIKKIFENIAHASQTGEGLLFYFKSETQKIIPHGIINLKDVEEVIALNEHSGKQFAFKIETEHRTFELAAEKEEDRESWIKTIKEKSDKAKESPVTVDESKFNEIYEKLVKGTAFTGEASKHAGELSDEPFSGDEEIADKPRSTETNKRKSFLPFAFGRKASTNEPVVAPIAENTEDDSSKVVTENTTEETEENKTGEPKSPLKASKFLSFFNKKPESTQSTPKADDDKAKPADETTNAETSNAAATTNGAEHPEAEKSKKFTVSDFFTKKATSSKEIKETPKDENKEVTEQGEQTESAATDGAEHPEAEKSKKFNVSDFFTKKATSSKETKETPKEENKEVTEQGEQTESKPETTETPADETSQQKEGGSFFKNIFKKGETSETAKAETTEPSSADVTTTEPKNDGNKETEETTDTHDAEDKDKTEDKAEPSLVRRVTTKFFGGKRAKSPKADEKKLDSISRDLVDKIEEAEEKKDETEEKKDETEETKPTENADVTAQTTEQTTEQNAEQTAVPESSTETENKKKEKSSIFSNFGRRKSGGVKKENSESQEKAETDGEAVASATEATDVEEPKEEKTERANQKPVFPDEKRTKKSGNLQKQTGFISRSFEQRYFVLTDDKKLHYYRNSNDAATQKSIDILKVKIGDGNKFDLETKSRTYKLVAESEEDRESWIKVFKELGFEVESHESTSASESKESPKKLEEVVPSGSGNENDIEKSVKDAADKSADTADAKVTEAKETTTQTAKVEESTEEITTVTTETTEIQISS